MPLGVSLGKQSQQNYNTRLQFQGGTSSVPRITFTRESLKIIDTRFKIFKNLKNNAFILDDPVNGQLDVVKIGSDYEQTENLFIVYNSLNKFFTNFTNDRFTIMSQNAADGSILFP